MRILFIGINHRTAPVELREKLAIPDDQLEAIYTELHAAFPAGEFVVLSTCNRTEIYVARPTHETPSASQLRQLLAERAGVSAEQITSISIQREQEQALQHLFRVCSGLDSMVLGEPQILGQVKRAYDAAVSCHTVGAVLHRVFQQAIAAAKRVRTATGIDSGRVSVGSVAVDFARQIFEDFSDKTIVGIGAGEMAKTTLRHLQQLQPRQLWLANRSVERATHLADHLGLAAPRGGVRPWEELDELLVEADIVITSTGAREPIITSERFRPLAKRRRNRPLFLIDIAVPRDIEAEVGSLNNVYLYNIDDLSQVVAANMDQRRDQVQQCEHQLNQAVRECLRQIQHRDLGQLIRQLRMRLHELGQTERLRTRGKIGNLTDEQTADAVDELVAEHTHRLINKILHLPLSQLDQRNQDVEAPLGFYAAALRRLFNLEDRLEDDDQASGTGADVEKTPSDEAKVSAGKQESADRSNKT